MKKQRKRVTTKMILDAANWVGANLHSINDMTNDGVKLSKAEWCKLLSDGVGEQFTITTALEILTANGVNVTPVKTVEKLETRVLSLEQQVVGLLREIKSMQAAKPEPVNGNGQLFPRAFNNESEVNCELSRS